MVRKFYIFRDTARFYDNTKNDPRIQVTNHSGSHVFDAKRKQSTDQFSKLF